MRRLLSIALLSLAFLAFSFAPAQAEERPYHTQATLLSPVTAAGGGESVAALLQITLDPGWKTYWRTPGDAGLPPNLDWAGSENLESAALLWPAPHRFTMFDLDNFGYKDEVLLPLDLDVTTPGTALALKLKLDLLVCADICVPETHYLTLDLPAGLAEPSEDAALYKKALTGLPQDTGEGFSFTSARLQYDRENRNYLTVTAQTPIAPEKDGKKDADLFIEHASGIGFGKPAVSYDAAAQIISFRAPVVSNDPLEKIDAALHEGQFTLTFTDGNGSVEGNLPLDAASATEVMPVLTFSEKINDVLDWRIAVFALLGGLVLNLMPCVLPVLSLKILSVVSHGGKDNKKKIFRNFMASALGILVSFWIMAGILSGMKAAGSAIGWGIQFQHPAFLIFLIAVVLAFAANMWGIFEIPLPRFIARNIPARHEHEPTLAGHFLTGVFATLLATPCTAPFLGTAVGFALARAAADIFIIFTFIGLGLALPYILLAVSPGIFRFMPRPGKWMGGLKKILAAALLLTALWLANVLVTITTTAALDEGWEKFDVALIAPAVADGKVVMVDVTADWCLTCKANKRLVLEQKDILEALSGPEILRLQADWTQRDAAIGDYLRKYGRYGIPFNIVYGPHAPEGIALPELLSKRAVLDALAEAAGE